MKIERCKQCGGPIFNKIPWWYPKWFLCYGHPKRLSELEKMGKLDNNDVLLITDVSEHTSKRVTVRDLKNFILS
jgi:hypothetical protein